MPNRVFDGKDKAGKDVFYVEFDGVISSSHSSKESADAELVHLEKLKNIQIKNPTKEKIEKFNKDPSDNKPNNKI